MQTYGLAALATAWERRDAIAGLPAARQRAGASTDAEFRDDIVVGDLSRDADALYFLLDRPYPDAPVSPLFYLGRREDLAFEKPAGQSADRRHHVRFWKVLDKGEEQRPVWLGAVTFDKGVGVSHFTGAITHHIDADIDAERDHLVSDIENAGMATAKYQVTGVGPTLTGRNGGGDPYYTDGEVWILRLAENCQKQAGPVATLPSPPATELKDQIWHAIAESLPK